LNNINRWHSYRGEHTERYSFERSPYKVKDLVRMSAIPGPIADLELILI